MLYVHRSERADALVSDLADLVSDPLDDPMRPEVVSVPTRGIERWLTQRLATRLGTRLGGVDGVCANIDFPFPGVLVSGALARASDIDPALDPWVPERAVWPLMEVVGQHFDEPWLAPLAEHIRKSGPRQDEGRGEGGEGDEADEVRFSSIRHVADLFDRYAVHRPDMLLRWAEGKAQLDEAIWQFDLWRLLRERIGQASPAERLRDACRRLSREAELLEQPPRLSLFGLTRLPASYLQVLEAIGKRCAVHLFLLHPSHALWDRLQGQVDAGSRHLLRREDPTATVPRNPLLASWGRDAREMQLVLGGAVTAEASPAETRTGARTLLQRIQDDVRADRAPGAGSDMAGEGDARPLLEADDDSIRVHSCHGRSRQVEVLRDAVLHLLADDPSLEPRDVIVMCPDIEHFAPLIEATFGVHDERDSGTQQLQIRLADRSLRQTNPVMGVLSEVLELATARVTATEVLDLAGREPVRRRFHFSDDDLARMEAWARGAHVSWGFDAAHREPFKLSGIATNTWRAGLDRVLLGVAMADQDERLFSDTLPLDDVDSGDIDLVGRLAEFVTRLRSAVDALDGHRTIAGWAEALAAVSDSLTAPAPSDAWQRSELTGLLEELVDQATVADGTSAAELSCDDMRSLLADRLKGRPTRANFRTGHLTVCTLVPMRSVPHRVVCLLGLDDGSFPRHVERDGDDITAQAPRVGDRDPRSEDRQLLLDAVLAAQEHLVVTFSGRDERSNQHRPPAVPVGELLDVADRTMRTEKGRVRDTLIVEHPLQPFDARNYVPGVLGLDGPWSHDTVSLAGARAAEVVDHVRPVFLTEPLPEWDEPISLESLDRFVRHPVRAFLRERLGVSLWDRTHEFEDAIPIDVAGLAEWGVADRMLRARLRGASWAECRAAEVARGALPPGALADSLLAHMEEAVEALVVAASEDGGPPPTSLDVAIDLPGTLGVTGTVTGVRGDVVHNVTYSRMQPTLRLAAWVRLLALSAAWPDRPFEAVTIGRAEKYSRHLVTVSRMGPLGPDAASRERLAEEHLGGVVELFKLGMREPLPLYCKTSAAYAAAREAGADDADDVAKKAWETTQRGRNNEDRDAEHLFVLGELPFKDLVNLSGRADDGGLDRFTPPETSRFGLYARLLWSGLLEYETVRGR
ncbi:MAG TPA: exodeoxyribonuclease V subunit gamma [Acidimicrobiales bacterium]|nr:exodeoxyribonuclease V subunit gamma [Acidimicrobiales bacterium]